jgi:hypothetical protein
MDPLGLVESIHRYLRAMDKFATWVHDQASLLHPAKILYFL